MTAVSPTQIPDYTRFAIGFDQRDRARFHQLIDQVIDSGHWSEWTMTERFEQAWEAWNGVPAVATNGWTGGAMAALHFAEIGPGDTVLCPSNTFMASALAILRTGAEVQFVDCNREDLCMSFSDFEQKAEQHKPKAAMLVHIGGHIAFDSEQIATYCRDNGIFLIEDCAHAHGASWNGVKPGTYGDVGVYSMYATKTVSTGEGGMLVSKRPEIIEHARAFRNYGKPHHEVHGLNYRMNEFTAALGLIQTERMEEIVAWKNQTARDYLDPQFKGSKLALPDGMVSGLYKYIVLEWLEKSTGRVYDEPCHRVLGHHVDLPNSDWVVKNHSCPPLYYRPLDAGNATEEGTTK